MKRINGHISIIYGVSLASCVYLGYLMGGINTTTAGPIKQGTAIAADNKVLIEEIAEQNKIIIKHQEKVEKIVEYLFKYELGTPVPRFEEEGRKDEN